MATVDRAFVYSRQKNYQNNKKISQSIVFQKNLDTMGDISAPVSAAVKVNTQVGATVVGDAPTRQTLQPSAYVNVLNSYRLFFGPVSTLYYERLNSNIYKNIFPEAIVDISYLNEMIGNIPTTTSDIIQQKHGLELYDVVYRDAFGQYKKALAEDSERAAAVGIVTKVSSPNVFTLMASGRSSYGYMPYDDTSVLYLSDKKPGKIVHYTEITNTVYIPVAIYTNESIVINIQQGSIGDKMAPYTEDNVDFDPYSLAELDDVVNQIRIGVQS